ncbi:MAG: hypothetical protein ABIR26_07490 [Ramlibacter sp.]
MKRLLIAVLCAAGVAHAQTSWKLATGYLAESFHTPREWVRLVGNEANQIFIPYYTQ